MIEVPLTKEQHAEKNIKRDLMREFNALYLKTEEPHNFSSIEQIDNETIKVSLRQYPEQGKTEDVTIYDELIRLRAFGWQLRSLKYDKDGDLHMFFQKVDWRTREFYGLMPTKYNNERDIWWLNPDAEPEELGL